MRCFAFGALLLFAASASANDRLGRLDESVVAPACRHYENVPADAPQRVVLQAKVSIASCTAMIRLNGAQRTLVAPEASRDALSQAARPVLDMLDDVITAGDPAASILAQAAKANIYDGMAVRLRDTVPPISATTTGEALAQHDRRHAEIEPMLTPWLDHATAANQAVAALGERHPELQSDPVLQTAVRESQTALSSSTLSAER